MCVSFGSTLSNRCTEWKPILAERMNQVVSDWLIESYKSHWLWTCVIFFSLNYTSWYIQIINNTLGYGSEVLNQHWDYFANNNWFVKGKKMLTSITNELEVMDWLWITAYSTLACCWIWQSVPSCEIRWGDHLDVGMQRWMITGTARWDCVKCFLKLHTVVYQSVRRSCTVCG